jgi:hypothetical protein
VHGPKAAALVGPCAGTLTPFCAILPPPPAAPLAEFTESFISTIGVDFRFRTVKLGDKVVKLQIVSVGPWPLSEPWLHAA